MLYTELIITFQSCRDVFQTLSLAILSLYDFLLRSYITGKLCTQSIIFFIKFLFAAHGIQKHNCREQATTLPVCCYKTSASSRRSQGSDAAAARRSGIRAVSKRVTHERDP